MRDQESKASKALDLNADLHKLVREFNTDPHQHASNLGAIVLVMQAMSDLLGDEQADVLYADALATVGIREDSEQ